MAKVIPASPIDTSSGAELRLREVFARLPSRWRVLHSVSWQSKVGGRQSDGEADFVLIHPSYGLLVVEVKGGGIRVDEGEWSSRDRGGRTHQIKDPFAQATRSKHALVRFLGERLGRLTFPVEHAVALPDVDGGNLGPAAPDAITWFRRITDDPEGSIARTVGHYGMRASMSTDEVDRVSGLLLPSTELVPPLFAAMSAAETKLQSLTDAQRRVVDGLRRQRRAVIYGSAGTGKTILALHKAAQLAEHGFDVLLLCFNRPLADHLVEQLSSSERVHASSFHKLCLDESRRAGLPTSGDGAAWWDVDLPDQLMSAADINGTRFDAIVVDEGQDFSPTWWVVLQMLLRAPDQDGFFVFADSEQAIYRDQWEPPFAGIEFDLTTNCRNTVPIARLVAALYGHDVDSLGAAGPAPRFTVVPRRGEMREAIRKLLFRLVHEDRVPADQIAILSPSKQIVDALRAQRLGNFRVAERGAGDVVAETVHRFKGLESSAVVLALAPGDDVDPRLLYIGMSRARTHLEVVGDHRAATALGLSSD